MGAATGSQVQTGGMSMRRERRKPTRAEWRQIASSRPVVRRYPKTVLSSAPIPQGFSNCGVGPTRIIPDGGAMPPQGPARPRPSGIPDSVEKILPLRPNGCLTIGEERDLDVARDVERAERVEADLDRLITRRHDQRVKDEGERQAEEAWAESERRYFAKRREGNRIAWIGATSSASRPPCAPEPRSMTLGSRS
jgi:hypothetical protein